jgi:hypothetical protein
MYGCCCHIAEGNEEGVSFGFDPIWTDPYELLVETYALDTQMMMMMHRRNSPSLFVGTDLHPVLVS